MHRELLPLMVFLCFASAVVLAQSAASGSAHPLASGKLTLKEGTEVRLKFAEDLSSKTANEGDPVNLMLDEDLRVGEVVVAKAGCKATGTITSAKKAGMMGKGGETKSSPGAHEGRRPACRIAWEQG